MEWGIYPPHGGAALVQVGRSGQNKGLQVESHFQDRYIKRIIVIFCFHCPAWYLDCRGLKTEFETLVPSALLFI